MKQFSLEEYLKNPSRKVVTKDGRNARIICTDMRDSDRPIIALIENKGVNLERETTKYYSKDGECNLNKTYSDCDLFFAPEKHEGWVNLYKWDNRDCAYYMGSINNSKAEAENKRGTSDKCVATIRIEWGE